MKSTDISLLTIFRTQDAIFDFQAFDKMHVDVTEFMSSSFPMVDDEHDSLVIVDGLSSFTIPKISSFTAQDRESKSSWYLHFPGMSEVFKKCSQDALQQCPSIAFHQPHRGFVPKIVSPTVISTEPSQSAFFYCNGGHCKLIRINDCDSGIFKTCMLMKGRQRCVVTVDAHLASCLKFVLSRSPVFVKRFLKNIRTARGFSICMNFPTDVEQTFYSTVYSLIEIFIVWPHQVIDYAWSYHILSLLGKHVVLEEGLAWLSTLGGAHSSLGESFLHHAEKAGEISFHQLRLARELGNKMIIARCFLYWSWSLLQRHYLSRCQKCIIQTWKYIQGLGGHDKVLDNMCKAVWSRLLYEKSLRKQQKQGRRKLVDNGTSLVTDKFLRKDKN